MELANKIKQFLTDSGFASDGKKYTKEITSGRVMIINGRPLNNNRKYEYNIWLHEGGYVSGVLDDSPKNDFLQVDFEIRENKQLFRQFSDMFYGDDYDDFVTIYNQFGHV